jgi:TolA-binding protein
MNRLLSAIAVGALLVTLSGCFGESAQQLMQTAEFEELQHNEEHARKLYARVISEYPASAEAQKAAERLKALEQP